MKECEGIIHCVGALMEGTNYQDTLKNGISNIFSGKIKNPLDLYNEFTKVSSNPQSNYDQSLEALNRDSCKLVAEHYNMLC